MLIFIPKKNLINIKSKNLHLIYHTNIKQKIDKKKESQIFYYKIYI